MSDRDIIKQQGVRLPVIASSDIWDTIIRRSCHPEAIKYQIARQIFLNYHTSLVSKNLTIDEIYFERLKVERLLGRKATQLGDDDEYKLQDVIYLLIETITRIDSEQIGKVVDTVVEMEINLEIRCTYPDPQYKSFISQISYDRLFYLSDFYMTKNQLDRILYEHKLSALFHGGMTSCDEGKNKRSSRLFDRFLDTQNIEPDDMLHIGDNAYSDVEVPENLGIKAIHYINDEEEELRAKHVTLFDDKNMLFDEVLATVLDRSNLSRQEEELYRIGVNLAPLFVGFAEFILQEAIVKNIDKILFITREGKFLAEVFESYLKGKKQGGDTLDFDIPFSTLAISRFSVLQSLEYAPELYEEIWLQYGLRGVKKFILEQGVSDVDTVALLDKYDISGDEILSNPTQDERLQKLLRDDCFVSQSVKTSRNRKSLFDQYILNYIPDDCEKLMLVDVGWFGSCQNLLNKHYPEKQFEGVYLGLRKHRGATQEEAKNKQGFIFDRFRATGDIKLERFAEVLEVLTSANEASIVGYGTEDNEVIPIGDAQYYKSEFSEGIEILQRGVVDTAREFGEQIYKTRVDINDLKMRGIEAFKLAGSRPSKSFATLYFDSLRHDVFREATYSNRNDIPDMMQLFTAVYSTADREKVLFFFRSVQWREGIKYTLSDKPASVRILYQSLFWLAGQFKRIKQNLGR